MRKAIEAIPLAPMPVLIDRDGVPEAPTGVRLSVSHKHGRALAVASRAQRNLYLGVDLEYDSLSGEAEVAAAVASPGELRSASKAGMVESPATLVLSVKEAIYKSVFPVDRRPFDFEEMQVRFAGEEAMIETARFPGHESWAVKARFALADRWIVSLAAARRLDGTSGANV